MSTPGAPTWRSPSTVSHERPNSKHTSSSLAGIGGLLDQAWGQQRTTVDDASSRAGNRQRRTRMAGASRSGDAALCPPAWARASAA